MTIRDKIGVSFNPLHDQWRKSRDMAVNYMLLAEKKI
jgi:2-polyprenyl-6-hydroxyphenyl methylase/3-demethylubiquinone-9 3-methyltransferase